MGEIKKDIEINKVVQPDLSGPSTENGAEKVVDKKQEAKDFIGYTLQKMTMSGARGGEYDLVRNTLKELEMGAISPEVAKKRVWDLEGVVIEAGNNSEDSLEERKKDAHDFVFHIFHKMAVRGANDSEYGVVTAVLKKLDANEILPEEAKKIIWDTENNKQDWR